MTSVKKTFNLDKVIAQVPVNYYQNGVETNLLQKYWHSKKWRTLSRFLGDISRGKLLDVGCADGTTAVYIAKQYPKIEVYGMDYFDKVIKYAKKIHPEVEFLHGDAHKIPFKPKTFDVVVATEVLEHLENPKQALSEIHRVLKPGGILIIGQDTDSLLFRIIWWFWSRWKGSVWDNSHISCVTPNILMKNVKKSGFRIKKFEFINLKMEIFIRAEKA